MGSMKKGLIMKGNSMERLFFKKTYAVGIVAFVFHITSIYAAVPVSIDTSVKNGICNIKIDSVDVDTYKCEGSRAPSLVSYSSLYELDKEILVFIDRPQGNACDGGPLHIISKTESEKFKPLKIIDFCGGHRPEITSGPKMFMISIPSVAIEDTDKSIPEEKWELKSDTLIKQ